MQSERLRFEMDGDEFEEWRAYQESRREMEWD
jgi:hypothetical protein